MEWIQVIYLVVFFKSSMVHLLVDSLVDSLVHLMVNSMVHSMGDSMGDLMVDLLVESLVDLLAGDSLVNSLVDLMMHWMMQLLINKQGCVQTTIYHFQSYVFPDKKYKKPIHICADDCSLQSLAFLLTLHVFIHDL